MVEFYTHPHNAFQKLPVLECSSALELFDCLGAVWAFTHMAVLLGTQAKLIAYVGKV